MQRTWRRFRCAWCADDQGNCGEHNLRRFGSIDRRAVLRTRLSLPGTFPYTTGDVQWNTFSFKSGRHSLRAKFPTYQTVTWPAISILEVIARIPDGLRTLSVWAGARTSASPGTTRLITPSSPDNNIGKFNIANPNWSWSRSYATAPWCKLPRFGTISTLGRETQYMDDQVELHIPDPQRQHVSDHADSNRQRKSHSG